MDEDIMDVKEWVRYAQEDYAGAVATAEANHSYSPRHTCYLCQQSAEKILKAYTISQNGTRSKEHNLKMLLKQCKQYASDFDALLVACSELDTYITQTRYPSAKKFTGEEMNQALKDAAQIMDFTMAKLREAGY